LYESILKVILEIAKKPYAYFMSLLDWAGVAYGKNQHRFHSFLGNLLKSKLKAIEAEYKYQNENSDAIAKLFEILNHSSDWSRQDKMEQIRMNIPTSVMMQQDGATRKFIDTLIVLWGCEHVAFSIRGDLNIVIHSHITQNGWSELFDFIAPSVMERRNHEPREQMALHQNNFDITTMSHYYEFSGEKNTKNILSNKNTPIKQPNGGNAHYEKRDGTAQKKSDLFTTGTPVRSMKETKNDNSSSPQKQYYNGNSNNNNNNSYRNEDHAQFCNREFPLRFTGTDPKQTDASVIAAARTMYGNRDRCWKCHLWSPTISKGVPVAYKHTAESCWFWQDDGAPGAERSTKVTEHRAKKQRN
jgi:hypothetical protein